MTTSPLSLGVQMSSSTRSPTSATSSDTVLPAPPSNECRRSTPTSPRSVASLERAGVRELILNHYLPADPGAITESEKMGVHTLAKVSAERPSQAAARTEANHSRHLILTWFSQQPSHLPGSRLFGTESSHVRQRSSIGHRKRHFSRTLSLEVIRRYRSTGTSVHDIRIKILPEPSRISSSAASGYKGLSVRSLCCHRFHDVRHGDNPATEHDLVAAQAIRIPRSVHTLMMLEHHSCDMGIREVHTLKQLVPASSQGARRAERLPQESGSDGNVPAQPGASTLDREDLELPPNFSARLRILVRPMPAKPPRSLRRPLPLSTTSTLTTSSSTLISRLKREARGMLRPRWSGPHGRRQGCGLRPVEGRYCPPGTDESQLGTHPERGSSSSAKWTTSMSQAGRQRSLTELENGGPDFRDGRVEIIDRTIHPVV